jgi:hypothetical protein
MALNAIKNRFVKLDEKRTKWIIECEFIFSGFWKLLSPLMKGMIKKRTEKDINQFKKLAESEEAALVGH